MKLIGTGGRTNAGKKSKRLIDKHFPSLMQSKPGKKRKDENVLFVASEKRKDQSQGMNV